MTSTLKIRNWDRWQSYRKDRGQPPWIKVHRGLMRDPCWVALTDAQRGQLISIWMLAGDRGGLIPDSASIVKQLCFMKHKPNLNLFISLGFIEKPDARATPERRQHDQPEKSREEKRRVEEVPAPSAQVTTDEEPIDEPAKAKLFRVGKTILVSLGVSERQSGAVIGGWLKKKNDPEGILAALEYAQNKGVIEPVGYVTRLLNPKENPNGKVSLNDLGRQLADEARELERQAGIGR